VVPEIIKAQKVGVTAIEECSIVGVGRRADIDRAVSEATNLPLVIPTGIYREPWVFDWAHAASEAELTDWMQDEEVFGYNEESVITVIPFPAIRLLPLRISSARNSMVE